ncbi:MAG: lipopolysaccharide biosynthesis protein [Salinivirgaceae bacterium]
MGNRTGKKDTIKNSIIYGLGNVATKIIGLILIPLYTNPSYLSVEDFGVLGVLEISGQVLVAILSFSMPQCLTRWYYDSNYLNKQKSLFFTSLSFLTAVSVLFYLGTYPFYEKFSLLVFDTVGYKYVIQLVVISSILQVIVQQVLTLAKLQYKSKLYSGTSIIKLIVGLFLTIYLIIVKGKRIDGIFEAQVYANFLHLILLLPILVKNLMLRFEKVVLKEMLAFAYPLILSSTFGVFLNVIDRYSLNFLTTLEDVGVYSLAYKISSTLKITIVMSIQYALSPVIYKKMNDPDAKTFYAGLLSKFSFILMFFSIILSLFSLEMIKILTGDIIYWDANYIIPTLILGVFFGMTKDTTQIGLNIMKQTQIIGIVIITISLLNLGLNVLLIPLIDYHGAALSTLFSQFLYFYIIYYKSQKVYNIPYKLNKHWLLIVLGSLIMYSGLLLNSVTGWIRIPIKLVAITSFPIALYYLKYFTSEEVELVTSLWQRWKNPKSWLSNIKALKAE